MGGCKSVQPNKQPFDNYLPFGVSYEKVRPAEAKRYELLILEPGHYSKAGVDSLKQYHTKLVAYLSLGEVNPNRWYFPELKRRGFLGKNKNWDSYYINLADSASRAVLLDKVVPELMIKGFDGLFLDTVDDVAPYTERENLQPYMISVIHQLRARYTNKLIIQNAGLFLLDQTASLINAVLIEDVATNYDFQHSRYHLKTMTEFQQQKDHLQSLYNQYGKPFLMVDFAKTDALKKKVRERLNRLPFPYFIGTIELNNLSDSESKTTVKR